MSARSAALALLLGLLAGPALGGCSIGLVPRTPRVARAAGYELQLAEARGETPLGGQPPHQLAVRVLAMPPRARVRQAAVQQAQQPPCSGGVAASDVYLKGAAWPNARRRPRPGETLIIELSDSAWRFALAAPSRLDLALQDGTANLACASFPLVDAAPENAWRPLESWTLAGVFQFDYFLHQVDGLDASAALGLSLGKWLGAWRVSAGAAGGTSSCSPGVCGGTHPRYYVPVFAALDTTLLQLGRLALGVAAQYKLGFTEVARTSGERSALLHGPALVPRFSWALPDPIAPGIPGGPRRGYAVSVDVPLGYVLSARGAGSFSVGAGLLMSFPLR